MAERPILGGDRHGRRSTTPPSARVQRPARARVACAPSWPRAARARTRPRRAARSAAAAPSRGARRAPAAPAPARSRSPIWTGGGIVFGPQPRHYTFKVNRKERRAALRSALSRARRARLARGLRRDRASTTPSTKAGRELLADWGQRQHGSVLVVARRRRGAARRCRSATSTRVAVLPAAGRRRRRPRRRRRAARLPGGARRADARRGDRRRDEEASLMDAQPGHHPPGRQREELRARGGRQVHVPRPPRRAQDADPPGGRGAVRRQRRRRAHDVGQVQAQAPRLHVRAHALVEEGDRAGARRATRSRSSRACRASRRLADADPQAQAHEPRTPLRLRTPTSPRSPRPSRRSRSSRASRSPAAATRNGRKTSRHRGGGAKRAVPQDRLQAPQGRRPRQGRRDRVRPQPLRLHRAAALRRRREALHPRARSACRSA